MVKGGRTREAAALASDRQGPAPDRTTYKNWAKSVLENPVVVESKVISIPNVESKFSSKSRYHVCVWFIGAAYHRSGLWDPMCCHKEAPPEEGPAAVLGWVWFMQMCSMSQQRQAGSIWHGVWMCLPDWHFWKRLWKTSSWLHFRYCSNMIGVLVKSWKHCCSVVNEKILNYLPIFGKSNNPVSYVM